MEQEYIITVFSENKVGLLSQITTVFTCRNVNIESLTTSESALAGIHKFTIVVRTDPEKIEKLARQVEKRIDVLKVFVFTSDEVVQQEIALYKVTRSQRCNLDYDQTREKGKSLYPIRRLHRLPEFGQNSHSAQRRAISGNPERSRL